MFIISGMKIEFISDEGDKLQTRNITTGEADYLDKAVLEWAIKLVKAEEISSMDEGYLRE